MSEFTTNPILLYLRCCYANKVLFLGYIMLTISCVQFFSDDTFMPQYAVNLTAWIGLWFVAVTAFGLETYKVYRKTAWRLQQNKDLPDYSWYCDITGMRLAKKDFARIQNS